MDTQAPVTDPLAAVRQLTESQVEHRLAELRAEDAALRTLLRSIRARERTRQRLAPKSEGRRDV